jgi:hypothetical protein
MRIFLVATAFLLVFDACPLNGQVTESLADSAFSNIERQGDQPASAGTPSTAIEILAAGDDAQRDPPSEENSTSPVESLQRTPVKRPDFNRDIYYKNKLEFSLESGWLPINVPFVWDFLVSSPYTVWPLAYTMVPTLVGVRWQTGDVKGPVILRGNWDLAFSGSYTDIPRGPETRYFAFDFGIRRNFVPRRWRVVPYYEMRGGLGDINAKGYKVLFGQGQDLTFTYMMGSGARYNINPRWSVTAGLNYMHVSNFYLSEPKNEDYGINVYGPMVGMNLRLGKEKARSVQ